MATRYAGQKLRYTYGPIGGDAVANDRLSAFQIPGAVAGAEPLCTQFS